MADEETNICENLEETIRDGFVINKGNDDNNTAFNESDKFNENIMALELKITVLESHKLKFKEENENLQNTLSNLKSDFRLRNEQLLKNFEDAKRDKESMVLKFAQSEQKNIELHKKVRELDGKLREKNNSFDQISSEKDKLVKEMRTRVSDYSTYEKELNNLKVSLTIAEQKLKNEDLKHKEEVERNKDIKKKYEDLHKGILVIKEENSTLRANCQDIVKTYQDSEDMRSNSLSSSIKQIREELRKCTEEKKEALDNNSKVNSELQSLKQVVNSQTQEIKTVKDKRKHAEADRMCLEETIKQLKDSIKSLNFVKDQLNERISYLEPFESQITQLSQEKSRLTDSNIDLKKNAKDAELLTVMLRQKESELLEFIQSLSNKNAELQTEKQELLKERDKDHLQVCKFDQKYKEAFVKINFWEQKWKSESQMWIEEREKFIKEIAALKSEIIAVHQKLSECEDQIYSLNKRHKAHIKDLSRHLVKSGTSKLRTVNVQQDNFPLYDKCDKLKASSCSTSDESRNSTSNLHDLDEILDKETPSVTKCIMSSAPHSSVASKCLSDMRNETNTTTFCQTPEIQMIEPHNQVLIEKIVRLQRLNAKLQDKIEFLAEHTSQLTQDIQKKSFLLKYLFSQIEEKGSIKSDTIDDNHFMMSKKSGIMASVYSSRQVDESMTLELSLEISRRLQSVLEDLTIKNITLKESINTLGEEISKLNEENRGLRKEMTSISQCAEVL